MQAEPHVCSHVVASPGQPAEARGVREEEIPFPDNFSVCTRRNAGSFSPPSFEPETYF